MEQNMGKVKEVVLILINNQANKHSGNKEEQVDIIRLSWLEIQVQRRKA